MQPVVYKGQGNAFTYVVQFVVPEFMREHSQDLICAQRFNQGVEENDPLLPEDTVK